MNQGNTQNALSVTQGFGEQQSMLAVQETASSAVAAQAKAMVESRYIMAMRNPRNIDQVRQDLLRECQRPAFANNKSAYYKKPIGQGVEGLGIRFVEVALRCMKNVLIETSMVYEDGAKEVHRVSVTDLESNVTYPLDVRVSKTVERSKPMDDGSFISMRKNSYDKPVYTVPANDDDLLNKRGALISKAVRTLGLRIIPGDLQDEAEEIIKRVRMQDASADPAAARKKIVDAFGEIGVSASDLVDFLSHSIDQCSPQELVDLRGIYGAINDGEATWKTVMENKSAQEAGEAKTYPQDEFEKQLTRWRTAIEGGKQSAERIISMANAKHPLTNEQKATILSITKAEDKPAEEVTGESTDKADKSVIDRIKTYAADIDVSDDEVCKHIGAESLNDITITQAADALAFLKGE